MSSLVASCLALLACVTVAAAAPDAGGGTLLPLGGCRAASEGQLGSDPKIITQYDDGSSQNIIINIPPAIGIWVNVAAVRLTVCTMPGEPTLAMQVEYNSLWSRIELTYLNKLAFYPKSYIVVQVSYERGPGLPDTTLVLYPLLDSHQII